MAGIFGFYPFEKTWDAARFVFYGLSLNQNRGQETCGIAVSNGVRILAHHGRGLVDAVFSEKILRKLRGHIGLGQVSFQDSKAIPPIIAGSGKDAVVAVWDGRISRIKGHRFSSRLTEEQNWTKALHQEVKAHGLVEGTKDFMMKAEGGYCLIAANGNEMVAARDISGKRPLALQGFEFDWGALSSEATLENLGTGPYRIKYVEPGEILSFNPYVIDPMKPEIEKVGSKARASCSFEFVYYSRPDSSIDGVSVYDARKRMGKFLAMNHPVDADIVTYVPETAEPFAIAYANHTGIPLEKGFTSTKRERSAIKPTQRERLMGVQLKLNPIRSVWEGKKVVLVDDSMVRGNTLKSLVYRLKTFYGAKEIHVIIASPKIVHPCPYGGYVPGEDELIARWLTDKEIARVLNVDSFANLRLDKLIESIGMKECDLCTKCFQKGR